MKQGCGRPQTKNKEKQLEIWYKWQKQAENKKKAEILAKENLQENQLKRGTLTPLMKGICFSTMSVVSNKYKFNY